MIAVGIKIIIKVLVNLLSTLGRCNKQIGIVSVQTFLQAARDRIERAVKSTRRGKFKRTATMGKNDIVAFEIVYNALKRNIVVDNSRVVELVALCEARSDTYENIAVLQVFTDIYSRAEQWRVNGGEVRKKFGLMLFSVVDDSGAWLRDDLFSRVMSEIFQMHKRTNIRTERAVVDLVNTLILEPLQNVTPRAIHRGLDSRSHDKRYLLVLYKSKNGLKIVVVVSCFVRTRLYTLTALNTLVIVDMYFLAVIKICVRYRTGAYARIAPYTVVFSYMNHIFLLQDFFTYVK